MLKCASVYTLEVDNPQIALTNIMEQLDEKITLLENSVGLIMCHPEFIVTGVMKYICDSLPFDLAGITTSSQSVNDGIGEIMLTIFVMTSDDVRFLTGATEGLIENVDGPVSDAYKRATAGVSELPKVIIMFPPFGIHPGDAYVSAMEKNAPNVPIFGTHAIDDTVSFKESETIYNGVSFESAMSFVLCYGNISPRFLIATFDESSAVSSKANITEAKGNVVYKINNMSALEFFERREKTASINYFLPFLIDLLRREDYDGVPVIRGFASFTDEGAAVFYGNVDEGSTFTMLGCEPDDIISSTCKKIEEINEMQDVNGALLFPCVVRRAVLLGANKPLAELQGAKDALDPKIPFMAGYAGGEICPTSVRDGIPTNRFHNYSLVVLVV